VPDCGFVFQASNRKIGEGAVAARIGAMGVSFASLLLAAVAAATPADSCPSHEQVDAELVRMGEQAAVAKVGRFEVTGQGPALQITIRDHAGEILGTREVEAPDGCAQRASVAAVVLAAWAASWGHTALGPRPAPPEPAIRNFEIAGWAGGHHDGDSAAVGAGLSAGLRFHVNWGVAVSGEMLGQRQVGLGPGEAAYSSFRLGMGPTWRVSRGALWTDLGLSPQLVRLSLAGKNLGVSRDAVLWRVAGQVRARVGWSWGSAALFVVASGSRALVRDRLILDDAPDKTTLAPWDVSIGAGLAFSFGG
jgi:hypothetical protein